MLIQLALALILGVLAGTITGLSPGIHINLIASTLMAYLGSFSSVPLIALAVFIVSMSITHTFLDFIPSIFLGAPEEDSFLSVLPGHKMLQEGHGTRPLLSQLWLARRTAANPPFYPALYPIPPRTLRSCKNGNPFILIFISLYLIFREENFVLSLVVFILAGLSAFLHSTCHKRASNASPLRAFWNFFLNNKS